MGWVSSIVETWGCREEVGLVYHRTCLGMSGATGVNDPHLSPFFSLRMFGYMWIDYCVLCYKCTFIELIQVSSPFPRYCFPSKPRSLYKRFSEEEFEARALTSPRKCSCATPPPAASFGSGNGQIFRCLDGICRTTWPTRS